MGQVTLPVLVKVMSNNLTRFKAQALDINGSILAVFEKYTPIAHGK